MQNNKQNDLKGGLHVSIYLKSIEFRLYMPMFDYICKNILYANYLFLMVV